MGGFLNAIVAPALAAKKPFPVFAPGGANMTISSALPDEACAGPDADRGAIAADAPPRHTPLHWGFVYFAFGDAARAARY